MHLAGSEQVLATEACFQASSPTYPLVGSLYRVCRTIVHKTMLRPRGRSALKLAACPQPSASDPPSGIRNPSSPGDDLLFQDHSSLAQKLRPSLSPVCDWLAKDDVQVTGGRPISAGGFADVWRGSLGTRQVAIKSYRRYLSFDLSRVYLVGLPSLAL